MLRARASAPRKKFCETQIVVSRAKIALNLYCFIQYDGEKFVPKAEFVFVLLHNYTVSKAMRPRTPPQVKKAMRPRTPPTSYRVRQTILYQSGTYLSREPKRYLREKLLGTIQMIYSWLAG